MSTPITKHVTIIATTPRTIYAMEYLSDRSNQDDVIRFIQNFAHSKADPYKAGGAYELVHAKQIDGTDLWICPGSMVYVYADKQREIAFMGSDLFPHYFKPFTPEGRTIYVRADNPTGDRSEAHHFLQSEKDNLKALINFLSPYGKVSTSTVFYDGKVQFYTDPRTIKVATTWTDSIKVNITDDTWIVITAPSNPDSLPTLQLLSDGTFRNTFISSTTLNATTKPKEPIVTSSTTTNNFHFSTPAPAATSIEINAKPYDENLSAVYDALAILRVDPREQDFEYAAKEMMELLSQAFNEGYDFGMDVAQTNPYTKWDNK